MGRVRHPELWIICQLIEFVNVGERLTSGVMALDPGAQFLAVAAQRLIPVRARSIGHQLRKAGRQLVWAPACQDLISGGHAGVEVIRLHGAPLSASSVIAPEFREFFRLERALRDTIPTGDVGVVAIRGRRRILRSSRLLKSCLTLCLLRPRWCVWVSLCLLLGDLNADAGSIPCLAKGIFAGRFVDLALAYSVGAWKEPDVAFKFKLDECACSGSRRDFVVACPSALAASSSCWVTDRWFSPHFFVLGGYT